MVLFHLYTYLGLSQLKHLYHCRVAFRVLFSRHIFGFLILNFKVNQFNKVTGALNIVLMWE